MLYSKEYYPLPKDKPTIGALLMVKNESLRIHVSLESVKGQVEAVIIYDTGSTDNTLDIIKEFCEKHKLNVYIKQGEFVDYATSRNVSLDFADTIDVAYILLLDCNDELQGGNELKKVAKNVYSQPNTGFLLCQKWWSGTITKYFNIRFVKNRKNWRYKGSVHEWMVDTTNPDNEPVHPVVRITDEIVIYQDRTKDDDKSAKRFSRDRDLLLKDYDKDPKDTRTQFYLAQTCECLLKYDEALFYSKQRLEYEGFQEERFHSFMRCANCSEKMGHDWNDYNQWYLQAYEHSSRCEPLLKLAEHYIKKEKWHVAFMFLREATTLNFPHDAILFVDNKAYEKDRWDMMLKVAQKVNAASEIVRAAETMIKNNHMVDEAKKALESCVKVQKSTVAMEIPDNLTRKPFEELMEQKIRQQFPLLSAKQVKQRVDIAWKRYKMEQ